MDNLLVVAPHDDLLDAAERQWKRQVAVTWEPDPGRASMALPDRRDPTVEWDAVFVALHPGGPRSPLPNTWLNLAGAAPPVTSGIGVLRHMRLTHPSAQLVALASPGSARANDLYLAAAQAWFETGVYDPDNPGTVPVAGLPQAAIRERLPERADLETAQAALQESLFLLQGVGRNGVGGWNEVSIPAVLWLRALIVNRWKPVGITKYLKGIAGIAVPSGNPIKARMYLSLFVLHRLALVLGDEGWDLPPVDRYVQSRAAALGVHDWDDAVPGARPDSFWVKPEEPYDPYRAYDDKPFGPHEFLRSRAEFFAHLDVDFAWREHVLRTGTRPPNEDVSA